MIKLEVISAVIIPQSHAHNSLYVLCKCVVFSVSPSSFPSFAGGAADTDEGSDWEVINRSERRRQFLSAQGAVSLLFVVVEIP